MLDQIIWNVFEKTGSVEAYLYYKRCVGDRVPEKIEGKTSNRAAK